ncbi:MAG: NAD-dependent deacylase [bacterium]
MQISERLRGLLRQQVPTVALTGAGVSAESGVPTFRGVDGIWRKLNPMELASIDGFMSNPKLVWEWYLFRRDVIGKVKPNPGHFTLAEMARKFPDFTLVTQNVDNLHQDAGSPQVIELHGNIRRNKCFECGKPMPDMEIDPEDLPTCSCGGRVRPDVVWFGEMLPLDAIDFAQTKSAAAKLFFSIGTSAEVYPAAGLPRLAKQSGAYLVEINADPTPITAIANESLRGKSGEILPLIWEAATS